MKFYNKFIAAGLGLAISFSATNIGYMWFTDSKILEENYISFGTMYNKYIETEAEIDDINGNDRKCLEIDLPKDIEGDVWWIMDGSYSGTGRFKDTTPIAIALEQDELHIHSKNSLSNSNIGYDEEYITLTFRVRTGPVTSELRRYQIKFVKENPNDTDDLTAHWYLLNTSKLEDEVKDENINPDENGGAVTLPELGGENLQPEEPDISQPVQPEQPENQDSGNDNNNENDNNETQPPTPEEVATLENDKVNLKSE